MRISNILSGLLFLSRGLTMADGVSNFKQENENTISSINDGRDLKSFWETAAPTPSCAPTPGKIHKPTAAQTVAPTKSPTIMCAPAVAPTTSQYPTKSPTIMCAPVVAPTTSQYPTLEPTKYPMLKTATPTDTPTTLEPTPSTTTHGNGPSIAAPTHKPTHKPSRKPHHRPTYQPTTPTKVTCSPVKAAKNKEATENNGNRRNLRLKHKM